MELTPKQLLIYLCIYGVGFMGVVAMMSSPLMFFISIIIGSIVAFFYFKSQPKNNF